MKTISKKHRMGEFGYFGNQKSIYQSSRRQIKCFITKLTQVIMVLLTTFIYASNSIDEGRQLWDELKQLENT